MNNVRLAEELFAALAANDATAVERLCAPDLQVTQNSGPAMGLGALNRFNAAVHAVVAGFGYSQAVRADTGTGFVEEHLVSGTLADGTQFSMPVCVVADVVDGVVIGVREYFDSACARPLIKALAVPR